MLVAPTTLLVFGVAYLGAGVFVGIPESLRLRDTVRRRLGL